MLIDDSNKYLISLCKNWDLDDIFEIVLFIFLIVLFSNVIITKVVVISNGVLWMKWGFG